jgi:hypothetical protein
MKLAMCKTFTKRHEGFSEFSMKVILISCHRSYVTDICHSIEGLIPQSNWATDWKTEEEWFDFQQG